MSGSWAGGAWRRRYGHGRRIERVRAQPVDGLGGEGDQPAAAQHRRRLVEQARVGIERVNGDEAGVHWVSWWTGGLGVLRAACCVLRAACCVLRAACCVLRAAWALYGRQRDFGEGVRDCCRATADQEAAHSRWEAAVLYTANCGEVARWRDGEVARWRGGEVARWRDGEVARWRGGEMAKWRDGEVARWRSGALDGLQCDWGAAVRGEEARLPTAEASLRVVGRALTGVHESSMADVAMRVVAEQSARSIGCRGSSAFTRSSTPDTRCLTVPRPGPGPGRPEGPRPASRPCRSPGPRRRCRRSACTRRARRT